MRNYVLSRYDSDVAMWHKNRTRLLYNNNRHQTIRSKCVEINEECCLNIGTGSSIKWETKNCLASIDASVASAWPSVWLTSIIIFMQSSCLAAYPLFECWLYHWFDVTTLYSFSQQTWLSASVYGWTQPHTLETVHIKGKYILTGWTKMPRSKPKPNLPQFSALHIKRLNTKCHFLKLEQQWIRLKIYSTL